MVQEDASTLNGDDDAVLAVAAEPQRVRKIIHVINVTEKLMGLPLAERCEDALAAMGVQRTFFTPIFSTRRDKEQTLADKMAAVS